jgi:hypothetical protein
VRVRVRVRVRVKESESESEIESESGSLRESEGESELPLLPSIDAGVTTCPPSIKKRSVRTNRPHSGGGRPILREGARVSYEALLD